MAHLFFHYIYYKLLHKYKYLFHLILFYPCSFICQLTTQPNEIPKPMGFIARYFVGQDNRGSIRKHSTFAEMDDFSRQFALRRYVAI